MAVGGNDILVMQKGQRSLKKRTNDGAIGRLETPREEGKKGITTETKTEKDYRNQGTCSPGRLWSHWPLPLGDVGPSFSHWASFSCLITVYTQHCDGIWRQSFHAGVRRAYFVHHLATSELDPGKHITNDRIRDYIIRNYIRGKRRLNFPTVD